MHFTGKMRDTESNLDDFDARYYSSQWGRFMSPDWDLKPTAVPYAQFGDPRSLNLYSYVRNNPSTTIDSNGHCVEDACIGESVTAAVAFGALTLTAYLHQPSTQRSLHDAAEGAISSIKGWFSHSDKPGEGTPAPTTQTGSLRLPLTGAPGTTSETTKPDGSPKQVRRYANDGYPETDVDYDPHHGSPNPHAHDWGRPTNGEPPTNEDRGTPRDVRPGDPEASKAQAKLRPNAPVPPKPRQPNH
jgi:RHS repeat-associated protein